MRAKIPKLDKCVVIAIAKDETPYAVQAEKEDEQKDETRNAVLHIELHIAVGGE